MEALVTGIVDNYPETLLKHRRLFTVGMCILMFCLGIPMCTNVSIAFTVLASYHQCISVPPVSQSYFNLQSSLSQVFTTALLRVLYIVCENCNGVSNFPLMSIAGWSVLIPVDGFLLSIRHVSPLGMLLPNHCHWLVLWSGSVL